MSFDPPPTRATASVANTTSNTATIITINNGNQKSLNFAIWALRVGAGLLIMTCVLTAVANPFSAHTHKVAVKKKLNSHMKTQHRRDTQLYYGYKSAASNISDSTTTNFDAIDLVLPQFPTLERALDSSEVVVLYFAASWDKTSSKPTTKMIDRVLGPKLKQFARQQQQQLQTLTLAADANNEKRRRPLSLIYVSSDTSQLQFQDYNRNRFWSKVPYTAAERQRLKKYFKICAKNEMEPLHIERTQGLGTLVVMSGRTHKVVTRKGLQDLKKFGPGVLDYWTKLVRGKIAISQ